jgi:hypothetical protein
MKEIILNVDGNLYVDGGGNPFVPTIGTWQILANLTLSNNAVSVATGGSALTSDEHNRLYNIPVTTLEVDERNQLFAIPTTFSETISAGGLSQTEHDTISYN